MEGLIEGRIVHYVATERDARETQMRRLQDGTNRGNAVLAGEHFPAMIVRVFPGEKDVPGVNLHVFLDGNDTLWVTSVNYAPAETLSNGTWHWPERDAIAVAPVVESTPETVEPETESKTETAKKSTKKKGT